MALPDPISIVVPVYNEARSLDALLERCLAVCRRLGRPFELILVDDGSTDRSSEYIGAAARDNPGYVVGVLLTRNYGQHAAVMAGFAECHGEFAITLDADLQNPPEEIPKLVAAIRAGHDYVGSYRRARQDTFFRRHASRIVNGFRERTTHIHMTDQGCMLRAYDRALIETMNSCREVNTFIPALAYSFAANPTEVEVAHEARAAGESKYSFYSLLRLNFDLVTGFSIVPLQWFSLIGIVLSLLAGALFVVLLVRRFLLGAEVEGVFTLFALQFFLTGILLLGLGLMGEYVGRIQQEVRRRPRYRISAVLEQDDHVPLAHAKVAR